MDRDILRDLAKRYADVCRDPVQKERRDLWRAHNSLKRTRVPVYVRAFAWAEMEAACCQCQDPLLREHENLLRYKLFWAALQDDSIFEPWVAVEAACILPSQGAWGLPEQWDTLEKAGTAKHCDPPIKTEEDIERLITPRHAIDEAETARRLTLVRDAIGDILPVVADRSPRFRGPWADLSTDLGKLRGIEQMMWDMMDRPEWLHKLMVFMRDGVLKAQAEAEAAGDWTLLAQYNQAMPYAEELPDPSCNGGLVTRKQLWNFCASQETTLIGPEQFDEFMLQYQVPIMANFGLTAYGCCEDLTQKIDVLRKIPNLRRIAVSPMANPARCAEQIGADYVLSYRPSPADMVSYNFSPERVRKILRRDLDAIRGRGCIVDITLKDVETVERDPNRVRQWVQITRGVLGELGM